MTDSILGYARLILVSMVRIRTHEAGAFVFETACARVTMARMRKAVLLGIMVAASARADTLEGTEGSAVRETAHNVTIALKDGYALYTVRRAFATNRNTPDEAELEIDVPEGATANQLRILANGKWYDGELMESTEAGRKYRRLTGYGAAPVKDPALLDWESNQKLRLRVYPIRTTPTQIEYQLIVPSTFENGRYVYAVPRCLEEAKTVVPSKLTSNVIEQTLTIADVDASLDATSMMIAGSRIAKGAPVTALRTSKGLVALEVRPARRFDVRSRLAQIEVASDREAVRLEIEADSLSALPQHAAFVFAVDTSYSIGPKGLARQIAVIRAVASHVPTAVFEIVTYSRTAKRWFGRLVPRTVLLAQLDKLEHTPLANGSELPAGAALAVQAMASHKGPRRIIATTDGYARASMPDTLLVDALAGDKSVILHAVSVGTTHPDPGSGSSTSVEDQYQTDLADADLEQSPEHGGPQVTLSEADHALWTKGATASGGAAFSLDADKWALHVLRKPLLHLVRPVRVTHVRIVRAPAGSIRDRMTDGEAEQALAVADLEEGHALRLSFGIDKHEVSHTLQGTLWGKVMTWTSARSDSFGKVAGGLLIGDDLRADWTPFEQMALAKWSHVVSPVTSLIAIEPGARPSRHIGTGHYGTGGGGAGMSGRTTTLGGVENLMAPWDNIVKAGKAACVQNHPQQGKWTAFFVIEKALDEIMSVTPVIAPGEMMSPLQNCLLEAVWAYHLKGDEPKAGIISFSN